MAFLGKNMVKQFTVYVLPSFTVSTNCCLTLNSKAYGSYGRFRYALRSSLIRILEIREFIL
jgi:hypothetical protein